MRSRWVRGQQEASVAREAVELRHDELGLLLLARGQSSFKLWALRTLAALNLDELTD
jgi:hypothetical protein